MKLLITAALLQLGQLAFGAPLNDTLGKELVTVPHTAFFSTAAAAGSKSAFSGTLGYTRQGRTVDAYYFPGTGTGRAVVIAGVHGTELSGIEVARAVLEELRQDSEIPYSVIVVPALFPDNAGTALAQPAQIGTSQNIGRYSWPLAPDPNRQMPPPGLPFRNSLPLDGMGREIEVENRLLLNLIQEFRPHRIVNIHAIRNEEKAGVYADPRTDSYGCALDYAPDSSLAVSMAAYIEDHGGYSPGNRTEKGWGAVYYCDPPVAKPGRCQPRNLRGSALNNNRGAGITLGSWASTEISDPSDPSNNRNAIQLITMEFPGCRRPQDYTTQLEQNEARHLVSLYARSITQVFLKQDVAGLQKKTGKRLRQPQLNARTASYQAAINIP